MGSTSPKKSTRGAIATSSLASSAYILLGSPSVFDGMLSRAELEQRKRKDQPGWTEKQIRDWVTRLSSELKGAEKDLEKAKRLLEYERQSYLTAQDNGEEDEVLEEREKQWDEAEESVNIAEKRVEGMERQLLL